jgi:SAM-dependent methyltransferase
MEKKKKEPWFSDDFFWETYGPLMFDRNRLSETKNEVDGIIRLTGLSGKAEILDCCCGIGRHTIELASRGYAMTGVDLSRIYLKRAREEAARQKLDITWSRTDVRNMDYRNRFDCVINVFTSFGYFENPEDDLVLLKKIYSALNENGILFMEMSGKEVLARDFEERIWFEQEGIKVFLEYSVDLNWTELHNRWLFYKDGEMTEYAFSHRIFSAAEMADLLWEAGFSRIDIYGDFKGALYDHKAERLILIAHK